MTIRSKVKQISHHDDAHLHPLRMSHPSINFLHITVSGMKPRKVFKGQGQYDMLKGRIKVTPDDFSYPPAFQQNTMDENILAKRVNIKAAG